MEVGQFVELMVCFVFFGGKTEVRRVKTVVEQQGRSGRGKGTKSRIAFSAKG